MSLRKYGPGKFDLIIDSLVYETSLDGGADSEAGDSETSGWYGLIKDPYAGVMNLEGFKDLTREEKLFLQDQAGAILSENSQGFVRVDYYYEDNDLMVTWEDIENEISELEDTEENY